MFTLSAWKPAAAFNPNDPNQRIRTMYLPNAGQYESVYWDPISTNSRLLNGPGGLGALFDTSGPSVGAVLTGAAVLGAGAWLTMKLLRKTKGQLGRPGRRFGAARRRR